MNASWAGDIAKIVLPTPFAVGDVNVYLVKGEVLSLIDAGPQTIEAKEVLGRNLSELGYSFEDIEQVILTHHHPDHAGMLDWMPDHIEVMGHPANQRWLVRPEGFFEEHDRFYVKLFLQAGLPQEYFSFIQKIRSPLKFMGNRGLTSAIREGDSIPGMEGWAVLETPGHAQSHISFWREKDGRMIAGDHLLAHISPNPLIEPPEKEGEERPKPQLQYNRSLRELLQVDISMAYTGHGEEIMEVHPLIRKRLNKQHERAMHVKGLLKNAPQTLFSVCQKLFPTVYQKELGLTLSETQAQIDYLEARQEIFCEEREGVLFYYC
ncbi:MBL fold metallo-hydrolase [Bacillus salacetis]|uniref:MBL fold metallo-hydrolase n=1 Tax=Bacillus salacetis TaxID=2315464 RepID=A0A3A1QXU4_9BACI|nr:MBL fold metallo-hydrolase [Bacillus salacetis]RIW33597.1 MBL fold metallo-hydrolase [Bacillus salacetis]